MLCAKSAALSRSELVVAVRCQKTFMRVYTLSPSEPIRQKKIRRVSDGRLVNIAG